MIGSLLSFIGKNTSDFGIWLYPPNIFQNLSKMF